MVMNTKVKAIVLRSADYQENDRLVWLYCAENGKMSVIAKGAKKAGAKLQFATQPFCFGEFELTTGKGLPILTGCTLIESFYDLRTEIEKYYAGSVMLDCVGTFEREDAPSPSLFILLLKYLDNLLYSAINSKVITIKFILSYLQNAGYKLSFDCCNVCRATQFTRLYLDLTAGCVTCSACRSNSALPILPITLTTLRMIEQLPLDSLHTIKSASSDLDTCLDLLDNYLTHCLARLRTLSQFISL